MKKVFSRKLASILLVGAMAVTSLAGCGSEGANATGESQAAAGGSEVKESAASGDTIELTFWTLSSRQDAVDPIAEAFNASQSQYKITPAYYDTDGIKDACKVAAQSGSLPSMWFNWGGSLGKYYVDNDCTYDLTKYAADHGWADKFSGSVMDLCTFNDQLSGYPTSYNVIGMYYSKKIFSDLGLSVPETFEDFEKVCATLKENNITPVSTGGLYGWHTMRLLEQFVEYYAGSELHDQMNVFEASWDNEAVVKALTKYQEFCDKGYFPDGFITQDPNDTYMALGTGTAAMDIQGQWYDGTLTQNELSPDDFGFFPFPNGTKRMSAFAEMTQINKNLSEEELEGCIAFMDYYYDPEVVAQYSAYYNLPLPVIGAEMPDGQPNVPDMIEYSNANGIFTITDQAFPTEVADVLFNEQAALDEGSSTPEESAKKIQAAIEGLK